MPGFVLAFGYTSQEDAHSACSSLLSSTSVPLAMHLGLARKYSIWQRNRAETFWAEVEASLQVNMALMRTAGDVASGSQQVVKQLIQKEA